MMSSNPSGIDLLRALRAVVRRPALRARRGRARRNGVATAGDVSTAGPDLCEERLGPDLLANRVRRFAGLLAHVLGRVLDRRLDLLSGFLSGTADLTGNLLHPRLQLGDDLLLRLGLGDQGGDDETGGECEHARREGVALDLAPRHVRGLTDRAGGRGQV